MSGRVALVGEQLVDARPGGMNRYVAGLARGLTDLGADVTTVVLGPPGPDATATVFVDARPTDPLRTRVLAFRRALAASGPFEVVDSHFALHAVGLGGSDGAPVTHFHGPWATEAEVEGTGRARTRAQRRIERIVYRRASACVCVSRAFARLLEAEYGVAAERIRVIPPGIDLDSWPVRKRRDARAWVGADPDRPIVVTARRLVRRTGVDVLLRAWARLDPSIRRSVDLVVVGDGPQRPELTTLATELDVSVRFTGRVDDDELANWYGAADLHVVPSVALEGFGLVVLEALSCGTPSLVTDVGGLPELTGSFAPQLVVPANDETALAERLDQFLRGELTAPSRDECRTVGERHAWPAIARRHVELYREVESW